jgi:hypothetical protein
MADGESGLATSSFSELGRTKFQASSDAQAQIKKVLN